MLSKKVILYGLFELFFGSKKPSCCTKNPIMDPFFLLDYYFSVLEETKSPLNGFLSTQIKKTSGWTPFQSGIWIGLKWFPGFDIFLGDNSVSAFVIYSKQDFK